MTPALMCRVPQGSFAPARDWSEKDRAHVPPVIIALAGADDAPVDFDSGRLWSLGQVDADLRRGQLARGAEADASHRYVIALAADRLAETSVGGDRAHLELVRPEQAFLPASPRSHLQIIAQTFQQ